MTLEEKIQELGLRPINEDEIKMIKDNFFATVGAPYPAEKLSDLMKWNYVLWHKGQPFFYSRKFVEEHDVIEIRSFVESQTL